jgi:acetylornithine deacetylase/succinyl-diaminopimelate desuccinylase-like protein
MAIIDVQPAEPLELWKSGPFDPVIIDGKIFARGSCDDKGTSIYACEGAGNNDSN